MALIPHGGKLQYNSFDPAPSGQTIPFLLSGLLFDVSSETLHFRNISIDPILERVLLSALRGCYWRIVGLSHSPPRQLYSQ